METKQVCAVCSGQGTMPYSQDFVKPCVPCGGTGFITTTSTLTREERRFELIKAALTGAMASDSEDYSFSSHDGMAEATIAAADAVLTKLDAETEQPPKKE